MKRTDKIDLRFAGYVGRMSDWIDRAGEDFSKWIPPAVPPCAAMILALAYIIGAAVM